MLIKYNSIGGYVNIGDMLIYSTIGDMLIYNTIGDMLL